MTQKQQVAHQPITNQGFSWWVCAGKLCFQTWLTSWKGSLVDGSYFSSGVANHPYKRLFSTKCLQMRLCSWRAPAKSSGMVSEQDQCSITCCDVSSCMACILSTDISNSSFVQFQIWDFPGQINFLDPAFDSDLIFGGCGALIFVIDAQVNDFSSFSPVKLQLNSF